MLKDTTKWKTSWSADKLHNNKLHRGSKFNVINLGEWGSYDVLSPSTITWSGPYSSTNLPRLYTDSFDPKVQKDGRVTPHFFEFVVSETLDIKEFIGHSKFIVLNACKVLLTRKFDELEDRFYSECRKHGSYIYRVYRDGQVGPMVAATPAEDKIHICMWECFGTIVTREKMRLNK